MKAALEKLPMLNTRQLKKSILCLRNFHVRTMQNTCLRQLSCHAANKTFLNQAMNNKRLEFALVHRNWSGARWCRVIFSDKSNFKLWSGNRFMWVRRARGCNRFESKFTVKKVKHPAKVMVWRCFSIKGPGNLCFCPKSQPYGKP